MIYDNNPIHYVNDIPDTPVKDDEGNMLSNEDRLQLAVRTACWGCVAYITAIVVGILLSGLLISCGGMRDVPVMEHRTDTVWQNHTVFDSVYVMDSIYVSQTQRGDTVYQLRDRWHTVWRDRWQHDTIYKSRVDSVPVPYPVTEYVEKSLTWWQKMLQWVGLLSMVCLLAYLVRFFRK